MKTVNISPKVWQPLALAALAIVIQWIATGEFDRVELAQTLLVAGTAVIGYLAKPGEVIDEDSVDIDPDLDPDDILLKAQQSEDTGVVEGKGQELPENAVGEKPSVDKPNVRKLARKPKPKKG